MSGGAGEGRRTHNSLLQTVALETRLKNWKSLPEAGSGITRGKSIEKPIKSVCQEKKSVENSCSNLSSSSFKSLTWLIKAGQGLD